MDGWMDEELAGAIYRLYCWRIPVCLSVRLSSHLSSVMVDGKGVPDDIIHLFPDMDRLCVDLVLLFHRLAVQSSP